MWTSIRTKRLRISPRQRELVDSFVTRVFHRERRHVGSVHVTLGPAKIDGAVGFTCRVRVWSHYLGLITADEVGDTVRTAVQQASLRVRSALRRHLHKRHDSGRRISQRQTSRPDLSDYEARIL
jgi:ribosome-associated translation inhibitor RaiA